MKVNTDQKRRVVGRSGMVSSIRTDRLKPLAVSKVQRGWGPLTAAEQLRQRERLSAIGEMATTLVHEIKAPLNAIGGFARSMLKNNSAPVSNREPLGIIVNEVSRLEHLIDNVMGFANPERLQLALYSINRLVLETAETLGPSCREAKIDVQMDLAEGLPDLLLDRSQIHQVLENLCTNARQAMPRGGVVTVSTCLTDREVEVRVADTGHGIPQLLHRRVFEPFYSTRSMGTGLGLAVTARVMSGHGGSAFLDGRVIEGAAFCLRFPVPQTTPESA